VVATPIQQIRVGIQKGDWSLVVDGFEGMTGERLTCPTRVGDGLPTQFPPGFFDQLGRAVMGYIYKYPEDGQVSGNYKPPNALADDVSDEVPTVVPEVEQLPAAPQTPEEDEFAKFRVQHGRPKKGDGDKQVCRSAPHEPGKNTFRDDGTLAAEFVEDSRKLSLAKRPELRRPESKSVDVVCGKCGRKDKVAPILAPKSLEKGDESSYVCNSCTRRNG
jgi:DNA-directed RNA polymerase subunit M/transcription elongation factor TFIIS